MTPQEMGSRMVEIQALVVALDKKIVTALGAQAKAEAAASDLRAQRQSLVDEVETMTRSFLVPDWTLPVDPPTP